MMKTKKHAVEFFYTRNLLEPRDDKRGASIFLQEGKSTLNVNLKI